MRYRLRFGLLGPPVVYDARGDADGHGGHMPGPKTRVLLAALLLEAGRAVSIESLKEALWGGAPPLSAQASLHNHVTRLRRLLDEPGRLRTVPSGYLLRVDEGELDVHAFEAHAAEARAAQAEGDPARVVRAVTAALALWRGAPLAGLPAEVGGYAFAQRLRETRLLLLEWRYDAELALGGDRLESLVPELAALAAEYPLREAYHRQLMLALHRTGRRAEALAVHRDLRARLVEDLGIEPGPAVRIAHVEVLREATPVPGTTAVPEAPEATAGAGPGPAGCGCAAAGGSGHPRGGCPGGSVADGSASDGCVAGGSGSFGSGSGGSASGGSPSDGFVAGRSGSGGCASGGSAPYDADPPGDSAATRPADASAPDPASASVPDSAPAAPPVPPAPRPAQLPPPPAHFTGRAALRDELLRALAPGPHPRVTVISGMAGVGKSALALHVAHRLKERFTDGQLYVNLHGATPGMAPLTPAQALTALLRDLGADPRTIPERPDAASALLRSLLAPTRTLLVLDDAESAAQVRPLLPAGPGCAVIVTSRSPLTALDGARRFPLAPLSGEESAALLRAASGREGREGRDGRDGLGGLGAGHPLVELTGRLPLALRVVAARLAARRALTPDVLAGQLTATEGRLNHLEYDDLSVRRSLAVAHDALAASDREADRDAAEALRRIGALDLPAYGVPLMARLLGADEHRAGTALDRLVDVALLEETSYGRYAPHDLVREFAREVARPADGTAAVGAALRWYAAVAERVLTAIVEPGIDQDDRRRPTAAQPAGHAAEVASVPAFACPEDAFAWGDLELANVVALVERYGGVDGEDDGEDGGGAGSAGVRDGGRRHGARPDDRGTRDLAVLVRMLFPYVQRSGRVAEMEVLGRAALGLARRLGDKAAEAYALGDLAGLHFLTGRHSDALALNDRSLALWRRLVTDSRIRRCLNNRGLLLEVLGRYEESDQALRQSLEYSRRLNDPHGEAITRSHLGNLYEHTDARAAIEQHRRSLAIGDEIGNVIVQHSAHCNIGYAHLTLGEPAAAAEHFEESLRILGGHGDWHGESQTRLGLVRALRLLGRTERADRECAELLRRADARADCYTGGLARHQRGLLLRERGLDREAYEQWRAALAALDGTDAKAVVAQLRELLAAADAG
ncbi:tetratricopeptide repeat protein [Streptomyces sp. TRM S81-3]|uniref:Tetratricopeptide repeat protein n=1 Tax=Streptomyces griseicoloratus TaxID=2752516 RepID=A0A926QUQ0_9ACTN|nr:BTAD domain-containing putative transcriptional regulator [Streptomyces griseicoloratus]MBD0424433.1 tetratricopeptide repeat protein [Streptomyces griseicoloratus]